MRLYSPNGTLIDGTLDLVPGRCGIVTEDITQNADGTYAFGFDGGTDMFWDDQRTVERDGQRIFLDEDGNEWPENVLVLRDEIEEDD